jgi:uncharacterized protein (TIGR02598 family)
MAQTLGNCGRKSPIQHRAFQSLRASREDGMKGISINANTICGIVNRTHNVHKLTRGRFTMNLAIWGKIKKQGFSLIEVVLAIGIVSFSMLSIIGVLPVGIQMVQEAQLQQARASITNQLRSKLLQISFDAQTNNNYTIDQLPDQTYYFTREGIETMSTNKNAYFAVTFDLAEAEISSNDGSLKFSQDNARNVNITMTYPLQAQDENFRKKIKLSLLAAKQRNF